MASAPPADPLVPGARGDLAVVEVEQRHRVEQEPQPEQHQRGVREPVRVRRGGERRAQHREPLRGHTAEEHRSGHTGPPLPYDQEERPGPECRGQGEQGLGRHLPAQRDQPSAEHGGRRDRGERARCTGLRQPPFPFPQQPYDEGRGEPEPADGREDQHDPGQDLVAGLLQPDRDDAGGQDRGSGARRAPAPTRCAGRSTGRRAGRWLTWARC
jgi:hypothetical protein